jgi:hypothetical protein
MQKILKKNFRGSDDAPTSNTFEYRFLNTGCLPVLSLFFCLLLCNQAPHSTFTSDSIVNTRLESKRSGIWQTELVSFELWLSLSCQALHFVPSSFLRSGLNACLLPLLKGCRKSQKKAAWKPIEMEGSCHWISCSSEQLQSQFCQSPPDTNESS